jgi:hypothetical protein
MLSSNRPTHGLFIAKSSLGLFLCSNLPKMIVTGLCAPNPIECGPSTTIFIDLARVEHRYLWQTLWCTLRYSTSPSRIDSMRLPLVTGKRQHRNGTARIRATYRYVIFSRRIYTMLANCRKQRVIWPCWWRSPSCVRQSFPRHRMVAWIA